MTWAFKLPLEPRAKITVLAIADNARDGDGVAWPSRALIAKKSGQSRATVNRRMRLLVELGVMKLKERFREDGTQTTDEIQLCLDLTPDELMRRLQSLKQAGGADQGAEDAERDDDEPGADDEGGGCQADTLPVQSGHPGDALVTGGGLHSGHPHNEPSLEPDSPPNPPPGGVRLAKVEEKADEGPLSKAAKQAAERRDELWGLFKASYPGIAAMDQVTARTEFDGVPLADAEWAVSVCAAYAAECRKLGKPPKNAHLWLKKAMFKNFAKVEIKPPPPEAVWIREGSDEDRALRFVRNLARVPPKFVMDDRERGRGYRHPRAVGDDLLAMLAFVDQLPSRWPMVEPRSAHYAAWQRRFEEWIGAQVPIGPGKTGIHVPTLWPPKKDGTIYDDAPAGGSAGEPIETSASHPQEEATP